MLSYRSSGLELFRNPAVELRLSAEFKFPQAESLADFVSGCFDLRWLSFTTTAENLASIVPQISKP